MSRVIYLVAATEAQGIKDAEARGWTRIARTRFATPEKGDARLVWRLDDLFAMPGGTPMLKASDYESGPASDWDRRRWEGEEDQPGEKARFDKFVADGGGEWIDP